MISFVVAGVQMKVPMHKENISRMGQQLSLVKAKFPWVQMVVFSELCVNGPLSSYVKDYPHSDIVKFQEMAQKHKVWLIPGSFFERRDGKVFNTSVVINPDGELIGRYDKMFPFLPFEAYVESGTNFMIFDVPDVGRFGLSICYDMWFPETTRTLVSEGVEVLIHPVLTGTNDRDVELHIGNATAAMFQCYIIDVNGLDAGGNGRSQIIDPTGKTIYMSGSQEDILVAEIDIAHVRRQREVGLKGLGQTLKSFRDRNVDFSIYDREHSSGQYLQTLGPLVMPQQGTKAGLNVDSPDVAIKKYMQEKVAQQKAENNNNIENNDAQASEITESLTNQDVQSFN